MVKLRHLGAWWGRKRNFKWRYSYLPRGDEQKQDVPKFIVEWRITFCQRELSAFFPIRSALTGGGLWRGQGEATRPETRPPGDLVDDHQPRSSPSHRTLRTGGGAALVVLGRGWKWGTPYIRLNRYASAISSNFLSVQWSTSINKQTNHHVLLHLQGKTIWGKLKNAF